MIASFVQENHIKCDKYLPEFHFAINSAVHESTGVTPTELNLRRLLKGPLDTELRVFLTLSKQRQKTKS